MLLGHTLCECKKMLELFQILHGSLSSPALRRNSYFYFSCFSRCRLSHGFALHFLVTDQAEFHLLMFFSSPFVSFPHWVLLIHCTTPFYSSGSWFPNSFYKDHEFLILIPYLSINWLIGFQCVTQASNELLALLPLSSKHWKNIYM